MEFDLKKAHCFYFNEICKIPHCSKNEEALSNYLVSFAKKHNLSYKQDDIFNVIIYKDATDGYENADLLMIQAHTDMVCEKNRDVKHDFKKDGLNLYVENGLLKAKGTTLGADDGTGVAYMMAILADKSLKHPALECVFTVQEEIGLLGALHLKSTDIKSRRMISLDGGGETSTLVSSSGGCQNVVVKDIVWQTNNLNTYHLAVGGLTGGHSGGEIHKEKGNANKLLIRLVKEAQLNGANILLVNINGGLKDNAIPREAELTFVSDDTFEKLNESFLNSSKDILIELEHSDAGFNFQLKNVEKASKSFDLKSSQAIIDLIYLLPNGLKQRSMKLENLTLTSLNLGIINSDEKQVVLTISIRSALKSGIENLIREIACLCKIFDASYNIQAYYPGWNYSEISPLREKLAGVVKDLYPGKELELIAAHGGSETGVFKEMHPEMDIVLIGPVSRYIHTPDEELDLASFDRTYDLLTTLLSRLN